LANRAGGIQMALRRLEIDESRDIAKYGEQLKELGGAGSIAILDRVIEDEKGHYQELGSLLRGRYPVLGGSTKLDIKAALKDLLAKSDQGRKRPGSWIGDAIYGVNDGLGAIFGIVSGVSGATAREREAIYMNCPEARELLSLYYQTKGLPEDDAQHMVNHIASDPEQLLCALASERLGSSEEALSNPLISASSGALSTAVGASIPIIPFFFMHGIEAVIAAAIISLAAHFAVGAAKSLITTRSLWSSGFEMTIVGALEGAVTFGIGILLGKGGI